MDGILSDEVIIRPVGGAGVGGWKSTTFSLITFA